MRKGKLCFIILFLVLFFWLNPALSQTDLYPKYSIDVTDIVLKRFVGVNVVEYNADVYYPDESSDGDSPLPHLDSSPFQLIIYKSLEL